MTGLPTPQPYYHGRPQGGGANGHLLPPGNWDWEAKISRKRKISSFILISWVNSCNDSLSADITLTLHKSQVHCSGNMQWLACSSLNSLLCLQTQVAKLGSELFYFWPLLRNNNMATNLRRCTWSYGDRHGHPQGGKTGICPSLEIGT